MSEQDRAERLRVLRGSFAEAHSPAVEWLLAEVDRLEAQNARLRSVYEAAEGLMTAYPGHPGTRGGVRVSRGALDLLAACLEHEHTQRGQG